MADVIFDALYRLSAAFQQEGFDRPEAILLPTNEQGMRFISWLHHHHGDVIHPPRPWSDDDDKVWMEVELFGLKIRWPAREYIYPDGRVVRR
jgi:hypothetical protein